MPFAFLAVWWCIYYYYATKKSSENHTLRAWTPVMMSYISVLSFVLSALFIGTFNVEVECQKNKYLFWNSTFAGKKWHVYKSIILMKIPDRPSSVNLCNNNKVPGFFWIFGKRKGQKRSYQYCNHLPTSTTNQWNKICVLTKNDNLQVYFSQGCEKQHFGWSGHFFLLSLYYSLPLLSQLMLLLPFLLEV